jgi:hypothetical protein
MVENYKTFLFAAIPSIAMSVIMLLLYPLFLYPEFTKEIFRQAQKDSQRVAAYSIKEYYLAIPVMKEKEFSGAFEVYVKVTDQMQRVKALFWRSYIIFPLVVCVLLILVIVFSFRMDKAAKERENIILELQDALAEVITLRGIIPICASCKKVRDDKGYWNQIEAYIRDRSEIDFSHSICPECAKRLYPDLKTHD